MPGADAIWVVLNKPKAGTWTVTPNPGSVEIAELMLSEGYIPAEVKAKVSKGRISYEIKHLGAGQEIGFREEGKFGTNILGSVDKPRGTLRFKPATGAGGKRKVVALVMRDGLITDTVPIGTYKAPPPPRPKPVSKLRAKRRGSNLTVTFRPSRGADSTAVKVKGSGGTEIARLVSGKAKKARFDGVRWAKKLKITVYSISKDGRAGSDRTIRSASGADS